MPKQEGRRAMQIDAASPEDIEPLAELFDRYRVFYGQAPDRRGSQEFLRDRFEKKDSVLFTAKEDGRLYGFTQLYPGFSSVSMRHIWILNDLYVEKNQRRKKIARQLMETARKHAIQTGALRIELATQITNGPAQNLYESMGYVRDEAFYRYALTL